jgi:hypothetical protein
MRQPEPLNPVFRQGGQVTAGVSVTASVTVEALRELAGTFRPGRRTSKACT